ncbi:hypothetical protein NXV79_11575 [Bacteroides thetaiotaomicron]|jgi:hypothetical protein|uniref:hypothetical protein n=2 Tax=Bacteroides thetaiotaomicron TaxID=818 RepID=UPI001C02EFC9|nr:hypothetical protein [Bacteroides thetaiotaomicron]MBT9886091.1 hypothetical protein [Bacteroides thetaiotaomicron]MCA5976789.1 hypothetical protein [Bacteroides thetaiotaomicron]MCE9204783.1 hypothetical protein [Bacteroides thetaiotaomicron]MCS3041960.1 hypothetical protein [Bacteroides thetaiotaomicron]UVP58719.1 hypothetical protein NXV79_11575 [Bacteroides thetaiotaomicron]
MAGLKFTLEADVKKLQELRKEIEKVTVAIGKLPSDSPQIRKLEAQLSKLRKEYDGIETLLSKVQLMGKELAKSEDLINHTRKQTDETKKATEFFVAEAGSLKLLEKQAKSLTKEWLAMSVVRRESEAGRNKMNEIAKISAQIDIEKNNLRSLQKEYINAQKIQELQEGSIKSLRAELSNLNAVYDSLSRSQRKGVYGKELLNGIQAVNNELIEAERASGRFQRTVGQYERAWDGLGYQIQTISREIPNFFINFQTGIVSLTNNIPYLADEIQKARIEYQRLKAEGQTAIPVWKQITKSVMSPQTALIAAISLFTLYRQEISEWVKSLSKAKNATDELLSAESEMAVARKNARDSIAKEQAQLDILYNKLKNVALSTTERNTAVHEWVKNYKTHSDILDGEKVSIDKLQQSYAALSKEIYNRAVAEKYADRIAELSVQRDNELIKAQVQYATYLESVNKYNKSQEDYNKKEIEGFGTATEKISAKSRIEDAKREMEAEHERWKDLRKNVALYDESITTISNHIKAENLFPQPKKGTYDYWQQQVEIADNALKQIQDSYLKVLKSGSTQGVPEEVAKQYNALIKQKTEAEEKLKIYDDKGLSKEYNSIVDQNQKISDLMDKQSIERKRREEDLEYQAAQAKINAMADGEDKIRAQRELDNKKEIQDLERQREDYIRTEIEYQKKIFSERERLNSTHIKNYKKKTFDPSGVSVDTTAWDAIIKNTQKRQAVDWYRPLLKQYQSYADQRLAIEKQFNDDIALLRKAREKAEKAGDTNEISKIDRSIAKAISDKGKELMQHDFDILKKSPEYVRAFEDLKNTSSETLKSLLEQLEEAKGAAVTVLDPNDLREYTSTIQKIMDELDSRNPFKALADNLKILKQAEKELIEAKSTLDKVNAGEKVVSGSKLNTKTGKIDTTYFSASEALKRYNAAKDKATKANNDFIKAEKAAKAIVDKLANAITGVGDSISGTSGEIISLIGNIALFTTNAIDGIATVAQIGKDAITAAEKAVAAVEKASVILGIISAGIQLMQQLNSILPTADNQYEKYAEKVAEINKLTEAVNEYRIAALEAQQAESKWFSEDNLRNLRDYKDLHDEVAKAYKTKAEESQAIYQNKSGGGWITNSWNWLLDNTYGKIWGIDFGRKYREGQTAAINNLRIETRKRSKGFLGTGIGGHSQETEDLVSWARRNGFGELFDNDNLINKETAETILNNYGDKLVGQTKETLEALLELREKYDEYTQQLHEYVSSLYEPLVDNFVDSLWAWFDEGKDALDSFKDYASDTFRDIVSDMLRTIVLDKVVGSFSEDIATLYEGYASGKLDEEALMRKVAERTEGLVDNYENNLPTLERILENVNEYLNKAGIDLREGASTSQESSKKGFGTEMTHEDAGELSGRFTALQIAGEEIKNQSVEQTRLLDSINSILLNIEPSQDSFSITDPSLSREALNSSFAADIAMRAESNAQLQAAIVNLTGEVQAIKNNVGEMLTNSVEDKLNQQTIAENSSNLNKNLPKITQALDGIKQNTSGLSHR